MRSHLLDLATKAFSSRRKWQQGAWRRRAQFKTRLAVERLESRRLLAVTTFDNDNWNFVADNDASSSLTVGDTVRNDLDTFNPGTVTGTYGVEAFGTVTGGAFTGSVAGAATINDAINSTDVGGTVNALEGNYLESVAVNKAGLTLRGATGIATDVVIDPPAGNGITVSANGVTILDLRVTGGVDGINASSVDNLTISNVRADGNTDDGIDLSTITGLGTLSSIIASTNGDAGLVAQNLAAVSVTDGIFNQNTNHGIQLIDIAGLVSLTRVTANDNDANIGGVGDGVNMIDGPDAGTDAIGSLLVVGGSFSDTAAAGVQRYGIRVGDGIGVGAVHSVAGSVTFQSDAVVGPLQHISITGNRNSGVEIEDGGTTASITGSGTYSSNLGTGFTIASLSSTFTVGAGNTFSFNGSHGLSLLDITGAVSVTGSTANDNGGNGLDAVDGGDVGTDAVGGLTISGSTFNNTAAANVQLTGINVGPNTGSATFSDNGATANSVTGNTAGGVVLGLVVGAVSITSTNGASYSSNTGGDGIDIASLGGALTVSGITASTNSGDGLLVSDGGTTGDISSSTFSGNGANGIELNVGAGSFTGNVTLTSVTANSNLFDGVHAINLTATTTISGGSFGAIGLANGDDGLDLSGDSVAGTTLVVNAVATASANADAGLIGQNFAAVSVTDAVFNRNSNHGIQLIDIAGLVSLTRVTANDNDGNVGGIGDGVNMIDGADAGTDAIGSLLVVGGSFSDTAAAGVQRFGIRVGDGIGIGAVHSVAGTVVFQSDTVAGPLQHISITGNRNSGVEIENGGTTASITGSGNYSGNGVNGPNQGTGFTIASLSGTFTVGAGNTFSNNTSHGISLIDITGAVSITGSTLNDNGGNGLNAVDGGDLGTDAVGGLTVSGSSFNNTAAGNVQLTGINVGPNTGSSTFNDNGATPNTVNGNTAGGVVLGPVAGNVSITSTNGATYSLNTVGDGIDIASLGGTLTVSGITASTNSGDGLLVSDGGTTADISSSTFSGNTLNGIELNSGAGSFSSNVTLTSVTANSNLVDGMHAVNLTATTTISGGTFGTTGVRNGDDGLDLSGDNLAGTTLVVNALATASNNGDAGLVAQNLAAVSVTDGIFNQNTNHGIQLIDIAGLVSLTRVTANDNDGNVGGIGDGVNMIDGADAGTDAIGSLLVVGGSFSDTAAAGVQRFGIRVGDGIGIGAVHSVAGTVVFQSDTVAGPLQHISITGNRNSGVEIEDGGTTGAFTDGDYSGNTVSGINLNSFGTLSLSDLTITGNVGGGGSISNVTTLNFTGTTGNVTDVIAVSGTSLQHTRDPLGTNIVNQSLSLTNVTTFNANGDGGSDTFNVTPAVSMAINVDGDLPTPPILPGDTLNVDISGTTSPNLTSTSTPSGLQGGYTFGDRQPVNFQEIESLGTAADLTVTKDDAPDPVTAGTNLTYTITLANIGDVAAQNVNLTDAVPANTTFVSFTAPVGWASSTPAVGGTGTVSASISSLAAGSGPQVFTLVVNVNSSAPSGPSLSNTATASTTTAETNTADNSDTETTTVNTLSDLSVTKDDSPDPVIAGANLTYTITINNTGPSDAQNVVLSDVVPVGTTFVSASQTSGPSFTPSTPPAGGTGTVLFGGTLAAGATAVFQIVVNVNANVPQGATIVNTANLATTTTESNSENNFDTETTAVNAQADIFVTKTDSPDPVVAGQNLTYTILVTNNGASDAQSVSLSDVVPVNTTFVSFTAPAGWASLTPAVGGTGTVTSTTPNLAAGATATFTLVVNVNASTSNGSTLTNTALVGSTTTDPNSANNTDTESTTVGTADLSVTKTDSPDPVTAGQNLTYTIIVTNAGSSDAQSVSLSDLVPTNTTFVSFTAPAGWSSTTPAVGGTGTVSSSISTLAAGATATFTLVVNANASAPNGSTLSNTATVSSTTTDPTPGNNSDRETTAVVTSADLSVTKSDSPDPVTAGQNLTYTIVVTNNGSSDAQGVSLTDTVPANTTFVSFTAPAGWGTTTPAVGGTGPVTATISTLAAGASATFTLVVHANASAPNGSTLTNTATASSATTDPTPGNNSDTETTAVVTSADLSVTKSDTPDPVTAGQQITYTIVVTNNGPSDSQGVSLTDAIPADTTFISFKAPAGWPTSTPPVGGTGTVTATTSTLAAGASATFTLVVQVSILTPGGTVISNTATVDATTIDSNDANDSDTEETDVVRPVLPVCEVVTLNSPRSQGSVFVTNDADHPGQGVLIVTGTWRNDTIVVEPQPSSAANLRVTLNGRTIAVVARSSVQHIVAYGLSGNDKIVVNGSLTQRATLFGNDGKDELYAARGNDELDGGAGNDRLFGGDGSDVLCGGEGNDDVYGQNGNDLCGGDAGNDRIWGEGGYDVVLGGDGNDGCYGGANDDRVYGEAGNDEVFGDGGNDVVVGGDGNDKLFGGLGRDLLIGGAGNDTLSGEAHDDLLVGNQTAHDQDDFALMTILAEWASDRSYTTRVNNIRNGGGQNFGFVLNNTTVFEDGRVDTLWGHAGQDWFLVGAGDKIKDRALNEQVN